MREIELISESQVNLSILGTCLHTSHRNEVKKLRVEEMIAAVRKLPPRWLDFIYDFRLRITS